MKVQNFDNRCLIMLSELGLKDFKIKGFCYLLFDNLPPPIKVSEKEFKEQRFYFYTFHFFELLFLLPHKITCFG